MSPLVSPSSLQNPGQHPCTIRIPLDWLRSHCFSQPVSCAPHFPSSQTGLPLRTGTVSLPRTKPQAAQHPVGIFYQNFTLAGQRKRTLLSQAVLSMSLE